MPTMKYVCRILYRPEGIKEDIVSDKTRKDFPDLLAWDEQ